jgi:hypothetical protein
MNCINAEAVLPGLGVSPLSRVDSSVYSIAILRVSVAGQEDGICTQEQEALKSPWESG